VIAVDTSALVAIVLGEPDAESLLSALQREDAITSAATLVEAEIVVTARQGPDAARDLQLLIDSSIDVIAFDTAHARAAASAWSRFGKGRHSASLNFGDCLAYAVASVGGVPLLFKGDDFTRTDVQVAAH